MVIQPRPEKIGPQESGTVTGTSDIAAAGVNASEARIKETVEPDRPNIHASAVPWPGTPEEHAKDLGGWELEVVDRTDAAGGAA